MFPERIALARGWLTASLCLLSLASTEAAVSPLVLLDSKDGWKVQFHPVTSRLECFHSGTKTHLAGPLAFAGGYGAQPQPWRIQPARNFAPRSLALVDEQNNVQGYVTATGDSLRFALHLAHRPPHLYAGELSFSPETQFGPQAFACRTRLPAVGAVVQMASGLADSRLNDSLFNPEQDRVLRFGGGTVSLTTQPGRPGEAPVFHARLAAAFQKTNPPEIELEVRPDYYRSRYVPHYRLIDRKLCPTPPTGWMSWNVYFDQAGELENLAEARIGARSLRPFGLEIWSIESWQDNSPKLPVSNFHNLTLRPSPDKFPHGMKWLAGQIRELGFRPGIWTVPWGTGDERFYQAHRGWFLHHPDGKPMGNWNGRFILDPSQPEVRRHMQETHRTMSFEWGYEFFKIDGMSGRNQGYSAHFFERPEVQAAFRHPIKDPYFQCVKALREGIGPNRIFLACQGHYTGSEVAWADAARLGADIVEPNHPPHWANYLNQASISLSQLFTHNLVWYNDPDTLLVGAAPLSEARLATTVVALPGQLTFFGDKLADLPPDRMRLLQQALPVCDVHALDLAPVNDLKAVWDLKIRRPFGAWDVVSLFNWEAADREISVTFAELGLEVGKAYLVYDFWNQRFLGAHRGTFSARVGSHANLLLAVHELQTHPQFLATDRHISQGGVELLAEVWNPDRHELECTFKLVEKDALRASIHCPAGYSFKAARAEGGRLEKAAAENSLVTAVLRREDSGTATVWLTFAETPEKR
jgi:hypothetical protein